MPPIQTTTPPAAKPAAAPKPARKKPAPKKVIVPPTQMAGPIHKHTGFIIAIAITTLLLIAAAAVAYITWANGEDLKSQIIDLNSNAQQVALERDQISTDLDQARDDLENAPKPAPFFYTSYAVTEANEVTTALHSLTSDSDSELFVTTGPGSTSYSVYATPRVGFDGRVWLDESSDTDSPGIWLREFDSIAGTELTPSLFSDFLPQSDAMALSPDETRIVAAYGIDNVARPDLAGQIVSWNLLTGDMVSLGTLPEGEHFGDTYFSEIWGSDISTYNIQWKDNNCALSSIYTEVAVDATEGEPAMTTRQYEGNREFCME
ncbi:hypothetical protein HOI83_02655 [Candidatus Uhrbacteria bacterium]|jgi:hypothetical protein|nr:hypothetical protein [Candidatus Uhrbacteria bacterium]